MNNGKPKTNPKKIRREMKARLNRQLEAEEVRRLVSAAVGADAPIMARRIAGMRGGITVAEAETLVRFINAEAAVNRSPVRVTVEVKGGGRMLA